MDGLVSRVEVGFDHDAENAGVALLDLVDDIFEDVWLVFVFFV